MMLRYIALLSTLALMIFGFSYYKNIKSQTALFDKQVVDAVHTPQMNSLFEKADAYKYAQDYRNANNEFKNVLKKQLSTADSQYVLNQLAYINLTMNEDSVAEYWIRQVEKTSSPLSITAQADYHYNIGTWAYHTFKPKMSEKYLKEALNGYKQVYGEQHLRVAQCLTQIGHLFYEFSDYPDSIFNYMPIAYDIFQTSPQLKLYSSSCELGMAFVNFMKRGHRIGEIHCDNVIHLISNSIWKDTFLLARATSFKGQEIKKKGDVTKDSIAQIQYYNSAEDYCIKAILLLKKRENHPRIQELYRNLIIINIYQQDSIKFNSNLFKIRNFVKKQKNYYAFEERLLGYYHDNLTQNRKSVIYFYNQFFQKYANDSLVGHALKTEALYCLIDAYNDSTIRDYNKAIQIANCWLKNNYDVDESNVISKNDLFDKSFKTIYPFIPLSLATNSYLGKYHRYHKIADLKAAIDIFKITDSLLFDRMSTFENDVIMKFQRDIGNDLYPEALKAVYEYYQKTKESYCLDDALLFTDRMKSEILFRDIELMGGKDSSIYFKAELDKFLGEVDISKKNDYRITDRIAFLNRALEKNIVIKKTSFEQNIPKIKQLQAQLLPQQALILYNLSDKQTIVHGLYISRDTIIFNQVTSELISQNIISFSKAIKNYYNTQNTSDFIESSYFLYQQLLKPYEKDLNKRIDIIISPDRALHQIPFECFLASNKKTSFDSLGYFIKKPNLVITYTPSWKIFNHNLSKSDISIKGKILYFTYGKNTKDLPCSGKEIDTIINIFGEQVDTYVEANCRKAQFLKYWQRNYDILNLSLHAQGKTDNIFNNKIWFQPNSQEALYGFELAGMQTNAKLVVLSACETNVGNTDLGEGVYSLARYFFQAGTKSVIASLWQIENCPNVKVTSLFYNQIKSNSKPKQALSEAKRLFLSNPINSNFMHPGYWSGLVLLN